LASSLIGSKPPQSLHSHGGRQQPNGTYHIIATATPPAAPIPNYCFPVAINVLGKAVGYDVNGFNDTFQNPESAAAAALYENGQNILLGNLMAQSPGVTPLSFATAINDFGRIVGFCASPGETVFKGFLYQDGTMYDLNLLAKVIAQGLTITSANGINDLGQILATANDAAGNEHTLILNLVGFQGSDVLT
jgi:probable HAF family extracellular repeat protein